MNSGATDVVVGTGRRGRVELGLLAASVTGGLAWIITTAVIRFRFVGIDQSDPFADYEAFYASLRWFIVIGIIAQPVFLTAFVAFVVARVLDVDGLRRV